MSSTPAGPAARARPPAPFSPVAPLRPIPPASPSAPAPSGAAARSSAPALRPVAPARPAPAAPQAPLAAQPDAAGRRRPARSRARLGLGRYAARLRRAALWAAIGLGGAGVAALIAWGGWTLWQNRFPLLAPRHRPDALCFMLAERPAFAPPMAVEPSVAVIRGRFSRQTPAGLAIREVMGLDDGLVLDERHRNVGDFDVSVLWVHVPGDRGPWLVIGWMEDTDLATCSFHFASPDGGLTRESVVWGDQLLRRVLVPDNFRAGSLPSTRWRAIGRETLPRYGPPHTNAPPPAS